MSLIPRIRRGPKGPKLEGVVQQHEARVDVLEHGGLRWLNVTQPSRVEIDALTAQYGFDFHDLDWEDVLSRRQRPKVDEYPDYLFVVLHFPRYDKSAGRLGTAELDIFLGPDFIITLPNARLRALDRIFHRAQSDEDFRNELFSQGTGYVLYRVMSDLFDYCFPILDKIGYKLDDIEDGIFEGRAKEMVRQISNVKQEIIAYRKIIKPELTTLRVLEMKTATTYMPVSLEVYFDDIIDAGQRIWDILENYKEVIEALEDTNETVIQHRLNDILLVLTFLSSTILPLTLVTGMWGMNVPVPLANSEYGFAAISGGMVLLVVVMVGYFKRRGWF